MKLKITCLISVGALSVFLSTVSNVEATNVKDRVKRQLGGMGGACMQIYTVPKREVMCEPSPEVSDSLEDMDGRLSDYQSQLDTLNTKLNVLDPDQPKELPEEVVEKLSTVDQVKVGQAANVEILKRLDIELETLKSRIGQLESTERLQVAQMIETQTTLIKAALHQSNISLHDAYLDKLIENTNDVTQNIADLEEGLLQKITESETEMKSVLKGTKESNQNMINLVKERFQVSVEALAEKLTTEVEARLKFQNDTVHNKETMDRIDTQLTNMREHQARYESHEADLRQQLEDLNGRLDEDVLEKEHINENTAELSSALTLMKELLASLQTELSAARNETSTLKEEVANLTKQVQRKEHLLPRTIKVLDCQDVLKFYFPVSGVYTVDPTLSNHPVEVFCELHEGEGWTVLQRRHDGKTDFFRGWSDYKRGFGDPTGEYWIGLETIRQLTSKRNYTLKIELLDWEERWVEANYEIFSIADEDDSYRLQIGGYHGNAGDSMSYHNNMPFSAMDRNNDQNNGICATWCRGAWWYKDCFHSNLNGHYYYQGPYVTKTGWGDGVVWRHITDSNFYSLKAVVMKIRPRITNPSALESMTNH